MTEEKNPKRKLQLNVTKSEHKIARILQIIARIIAGIGSLAAIAVLGLFMAVFLIKSTGLAYIFVIFLCPMVGKFYTTSLKKELLGGILLICEAIGFMLFLLLVGWTSGLDLFLTLLIGIPLIISGSMFLIAWYLEKNKKEKEIKMDDQPETRII